MVVHGGPLPFVLISSSLLLGSFTGGGGPSKPGPKGGREGLSRGKVRGLVGSPVVRSYPYSTSTYTFTVLPSVRPP